MKIALGVFSDDFSIFVNNAKALRYDDFLDLEYLEYIPKGYDKDEHFETTWKAICFAIEQATTILVDLTKMRFPLLEPAKIVNVSLTGRELHFIFNYPDFLEKTRFFSKGVEIEKQFVVDLWNNQTEYIFKNHV